MMLNLNKQSLKTAKPTKRLVFAAFLLVFGLSWVGCQKVQHDPSKGPISLVLGVSADYPPFEYKKNGEIVGFDVDLAHALAQEMGFSLVVQDMEFSSLIPSLQSGRVDFVMSGMTINEERKKNVDFSSVYFNSSFALIALKKSSLPLPLGLAGKKIGVQLGTTMEKYAKERVVDFPGMQVVSLGKIPTLVEEVKSGRIDGMISEEVQATAVVEANPSLRFVSLDSTGDGYAVAFAQGSEKNLQWKEKFDQALRKLQKSGAVEQLRSKWMGQPIDSGFSGSFVSTLGFVAGGVLTTLRYTLISALGGLILGLCLALMKTGSFKLARNAAVFYTSIFRGTPMLVQLSIIYFGTPSLTHYKISPGVAGVIAFSLNSGAYVSEIIRAGIQGIDRGQFEASKALNISYFLMMKDIILPQAIRNILPALVNEVVNLLKETALISTLGEEDIMRRAQVVAAETYSYFEPLIMAAFCYYILVLLLNSFAKRLEKTLSYATN